MDNLKTVSGYFHTDDTTAFFLADVLVAMVPMVFGAIWYFHLQAAVLLAAATAACCLFDYLAGLLLRRQKRFDPSSLVTGLLYGLLLWPKVGAPTLLAGAFCATVLAKQAFGGFGKNPVNPALVGFGVVLLLAGPAPQAQGLWLVSGNTRGLFMETSVFFVALGAGYLLLRGLANFSFAISFCLALFGLSQLSGGLSLHIVPRVLLFSWFLASDPVTTATTRLGNVLWGLLCALASSAFLATGDLTGGMTISFCVMSVFVFALRRWDLPLALRLS